MSTESRKPATLKDLGSFDLEAKVEVDGVGSDYFLRSFVELVNTSNSLEIGITLHVEGCVISGELISAATYFSELGNMFSANVKKDAAGFWSEWISAFIPAARTEVSEDETVPLPNYIHLRNARSFHPGGVIPSNEGVLWRGRINAVSGFNFGRLNTPDT